MEFINKGLGLKRDIPDIRDLQFLSSGIIKKKKHFPSRLDLREHPDMPPIYDQGSLGSCTAQSVSALCDFKYERHSFFEPSRLFLYYVTRLTEGTTDVDSGATIRNTIKSANKFGIPLEESWPYKIKRFKEVPTNEVFDEALKYQALKYERVTQTLSNLKSCLYEGNLIAFGIGVYAGLYEITKENPVLELPTTDQTMQGGHAIVLCGWDDSLNSFIVRNSWGTDFGIDGYFYIPYEYVLDERLSFDFWTISLVER